MSKTISCDAPTRRVLLVETGGSTYGLPLAKSLEVVERTQYTPLPGSESFVCGMINLRGRLVTVLDLGGWLGVAPASEVEGHSTVVLEHSGKRVGLAVDEVSRIAVVEAAPLAGEVEGSPVGIHRVADGDEGRTTVVGVVDVDVVFGSVLV